MMKPSDIPDAEADLAASEAAQISKALRAALSGITITDPDALTSALTVHLIDAFVKAGNSTPAQMVGAFALCVTEWAHQAAGRELDVDKIPRLTGDLLAYVAERMR